MAKLNLHLAIHIGLPGVTCRIEARSLDDQTVAVFDLNLDMVNPSDQEHFDIEKGKHHCAVKLKAGHRDHHIHFQGTLEVGASDGLIRITRGKSSSIWLIVNNDQARRIAVSSNDPSDMTDPLHPALPSPSAIYRFKGGMPLG